MLGGALALLFPIDWPEPFGLVMIEAMACGTPVIAWRNGSVPEVIDEGATGFIVEDIDEAVRAIDSVHRLDRHRCRRVFEQRFSNARMARDYVALYERLIEAHAAKTRSEPLEQRRAGDDRHPHTHVATGRAPHASGEAILGLVEDA